MPERHGEFTLIRACFKAFQMRFKPDVSRLAKVLQSHFVTPKIIRTLQLAYDFLYFEFLFLVHSKPPATGLLLATKNIQCLSSAHTTSGCILAF
jgi:hypothetical protein